jgi:hypothetical protein
LIFPSFLGDNSAVKISLAKNDKSDVARLDRATDQLLRILKQKIIKKQGRVDYAKLREYGYSERVLARMESL